MLHVKLYSKGLDFSLKLKNLLISLSIKEIMIVAIFGTCRIIMIDIWKLINPFSTNVSPT